MLLLALLFQATITTSGTVTSSGAGMVAQTQSDYIAYGNCGSLSSASIGGWKKIDSAPRDGRKVELMQTYGIAPTTGVFKWDPERLGVGGKKGGWVQVSDPRFGMGESCAFWRPYTKQAELNEKTTRSTQYWCNAMHMKYNEKKDVCER